MRFLLLLAIICSYLTNIEAAETPAAVRVLFLGDQRNHQPAERAKEFVPAMAKRNIEVVYTKDITRLNPETLAEYDGLLLYANIDEIAVEQEEALLDYVEAGHGFIPLHCASFCFRNSPAFVDLVGAQFQKHGGEVFRTVIVEPDHPLMQGFGGFASWDETYIHHRHNPRNRTVLEYRVQGGQAEDRQREPWTWVRTEGNGRIFYTAWGHDERTWTHPGFLNLVERGIRWACRANPESVPAYSDGYRPFEVPEMTTLPDDLPPFEYLDVGPKIPNYRPDPKWGVQGKPKNLMQKPLSAEAAIKHVVTPVDFHVELFTSDPDLQGKPIAMNWDADGRLWVCETYDYPNELQPAGEGRDRIRICEDTDKDGKADRYTVFAENLSIPTAITFYRGGAIVQDGGNTLFLKDTDGDDKADLRKVLISNWNIRDTHGGVSNFQYGNDNWIWAMQGYNNSAPVIGGEKQQSFRMGFWRFRLDHQDPPSVTDLEFVRSTDNNTWGLGLSEEGLVFGSTANHNPSVFMPIPNRYYEQVRGWTPKLVLPMISPDHLFDPVTENVRQVDHHGGYTAGAGHALYTARNYPQQYWNRTAFVCGPTGHLVGTFVLQPDGAGYKSENQFNLFASDDEWSAPIMAEVGPDGNVWVLDWYNYIVQHNPTPSGFETGKGQAYESDLRDKKHGRVYRVVYDENPTTSYPQLSQAATGELLAALGHPTLLVRKHAQRLLVERNQQDVVPRLISMLQDDSLDKIGLNGKVVHALQTLAGLNAIKLGSPACEAVMKCLSHPSAGVRINALRVLPPESQTVQKIEQANLLHDPDPQVQLATLLKLSDSPASSEASAALIDWASTAPLSQDRWLRDGYICAAATQGTLFLASLIETEARLSQTALETARIVAEHLARSDMQDEELNRLIATMKNASPQLAGSIFAGIDAGWPTGNQPQLTSSGRESLQQLVTQLPAEQQGLLVALAVRWGQTDMGDVVRKIVKDLLKRVDDDDLPVAERLSAAESVINLGAGDLSVAEKVLERVTPQVNPDLARGILEALTACRAEGLGKILIEVAETLTPTLRQSIVSLLMTRPQLTEELINALDQGDIQLVELTLDQQQALRNHPDEKIRKAAGMILARGGSLPNPDRQKVLQKYLAMVDLPGEVERGKLVFKEQCSKCHKFQGEGATIGPDLTGMAIHPKEELLTHILDPNSSVESNFRTYTVTTMRGRIYTGMLSGETRTSLEIIDTQAKRNSILREDIDELLASRNSLMPEGFEKQIKDEDWPHLLTYLTQTGRYVPVDLAPVATIDSTQGMFFEKTGLTERMIFEDWKPKVFQDVPFQLVDPRSSNSGNVVMLHGTNGNIPPTMPRAVKIPCSVGVQRIHLLSGVSGWGFPAVPAGMVTMIVRVHFPDGSTEDHELINGEHFADYIRRVDVPKSTFAYPLRNQQIRYLTVDLDRHDKAEAIELLKPEQDNPLSPVIMAITLETAKSAGHK